MCIVMLSHMCKCHLYQMRSVQMTLIYVCRICRFLVHFLSHPGDTNIINDSSRLAIDAQPLRRHSDSDSATKRPDSATSDNNDSPAQIRRVSIDSTESKSATAGISSTNVSIGEMVKCRNPKCEASASPSEAKRTYKNCHNCKCKHKNLHKIWKRLKCFLCLVTPYDAGTQMYCSRDCRRAHWEKHRKACLHSRVSVLCRQVLSACKDDSDTLSHLSILARRGYLSQGRGVVRILFRSPENAEVELIRNNSREIIDRFDWQNRLLFLLLLLLFRKGIC